MSEYMEKHAIAKMIGSPPGYVGHEEGGQLTEKIKRKPYSVILLDEIEKAHPDILNILLQVLEDGMITDAYGEIVDFKNTIVIMTSNIGSQHIARTSGRLGFQNPERGQQFKDRREMVMGEMKKTLSPEFINRIDEIIVFDALSEEQLGDIVRILLQRVNAALADRKVEIVVSDEVSDWLVRTTCTDRSYGARPLRRAIQRYIEDPLSEALIRGNVQLGAPIEVFMEGEKPAFRSVLQTASS
jgi:ATP-dependent Clp protease ATP-binding subunit ClpC